MKKSISLISSTILQDLEQARTLDWQLAEMTLCHLSRQTDAFHAIYSVSFCAVLKWKALKTQIVPEDLLLSFWIENDTSGLCRPVALEQGAICRSLSLLT